MKRFLVSITILFFGTALKAAGPDDIIGIWMSAGGKGHVQIYRDGTKYFGRITWMAEPNDATGQPKKDAKNPNPALRDKPLLGAVILRNFVYEDGEWNSGRIYDPRNGKEYKCYLKLKDAKTLNVRGYIGFSLIGRTEVWTRVEQ